MGTIIGASLFAVVALWVAGERLLARFQDAARGADSVRRDLAGRRTSTGEVEVTVWKAHPLSDHMIKQIASDKGFRFVGDTSRYGNFVLRFVPASKKGTA